MKKSLQTKLTAMVNGINHTIVVILIMTCLSQSLALARETPVNEQQRLALHVQSLNELTERRRTNRLFHNEQSPLYGQRIHYTNVGKGNTSFVMRDVALINRLPIVLARVYDSSAHTNANINNDLTDFGQGWSLNYAETISLKANDDLIYTDENASRHLIVKQSDNSYQPKYHFAQIKRVVFNANNQITLTFDNDLIKAFLLIDGQFKLGQIRDSYGNSVDLHYNDGKLQRISNPHGQYIDIIRNARGLITSTVDHHDRQINFSYQNNLLKNSQDLAGNLWRYNYQNKQLSKITDPAGNQVAKFTYFKGSDAQGNGTQNAEHKGKTQQVQIGTQSFTFDYQQNITTVTNQQALQNYFEQNSQGITVAISNSHGQTSRIALNDDLQVAKLLNNNQTTAELIYDKNNQPITIITNDQSYTLNYQNNQLVSIGDAIASLNTQGLPLSLSANGIKREYSYNKMGEVIEQREFITDDETIVSTYAYDDKGLLTTLTVKDEQAQFKYNAIGQLSQIIFPEGNHHTYTYNALGFRTKTTRSDGSTIDYQYDDTGNLLTLNQLEANGDSRQKEMKLDENNLTTEYIVDGKMMLDIQYDQADNPVQIAYNGKLVSYEYDHYNRLTKVIDGDNELHHNYQKGESDIRIQQDERSFISRLSKGKSQHNAININHLYTRTVGTAHRFIYFDPNQHQFKLPSFEQILATDINHDASQRRRLYNATAKDRKTQREFDKPSSSIFTPVIYSAINCEAISCWELIEVFLSGPASTTVGQSVNFTATTLMGNLFDEFDECTVRHRFSVDGQIITYNSSGIFNYTFGSPGTKNVEVRSNCQGCATWNFQYDYLSVAANAEAPTGVTILTGAADHYINEYVEMPTMIFAAQAIPEDSPISYLTFHWYLTIDHTQSGRTLAQVRIPSSGTVDISGNNVWVPDWGDTVAGGSDVKVYVKVSNSQGSTAFANKSGFRILGKNPSSSQIAMETNTNPWFVDRLIRQESTNRQFSNTTGLPLNNGNGFGLMQVDNPAPSDRALWDWKRNIEEGQVIIAQKREASTIFWQAQLLQYNNYNNNNPNNQVSVHADIVISDKTFSHTPTGPQKPFLDGIWIKQYNGASGGNWLSWQNAPSIIPFWQHNPLNHLNHNYVDAVCSQRP